MAEHRARPARGLSAHDDRVHTRSRAGTRKGDPRNRLGSEIAQWQTIKKAASHAIGSHGGTISHHHGVGEDHLPWIVQEKGELGIEIYRAIKRTLDPNGILNPGKLIPP